MPFHITIGRLFRRSLLTVVLMMVPVALMAETLRVGADIDYAPLSYMDGDTPVGFDIEFFQLVAEELDSDVQFMLDVWPRVLSKARGGDLDVVTGVIFHDERQDFLSFSVPYHSFSFAVVTRREQSLQSMRDISNLRMAALDNDAVPKLLLRHIGATPPTTTYPTLSDALNSVRAGDNDFVIVPERFAQSDAFRTNARHLNVVTFPDLSGTYRMGITENSRVTVAEINGAIEAALHSDEYQEISARWIPSGVPEQRAEDRTRRLLHIATVALIISIVVFAIMFLFVTRRTA